MKSKVMNRPMFLDVENVGIMQGFNEDDYEEMDEGYESSSMIDRTPSSPEILMNNLRGDMRSIDARLEELAQLVGDDAAMETPPEVLALLQPVLAAQEGIGSLPAGMPIPPMGSPPMTPPSPMGAGQPAPDMGAMMPPPEAAMMPPGPPSTAQEPINMAQGGLVQRFRDGSDEEGVTPADEEMDPSSARAMLMSMRSQNLPSLQQEFETMLPTYQQALGGGDRSMTRAQMLFDIAQAGLNLAAGTDARGQRVPAGASFASSLAAAAQGLPERIAERAGQMQQQEQGVRLAALRGAESSMAAKIEAMKGESLFGKGDWEWNIINRPGLLDRWSRGEVTEQEESLVQSALAKLSQPRTEFRPDPVTRQPVPVLVTPTLPGFVQQALSMRGQGVPRTGTTAAPALTEQEQIDAEADATIVRDEQGNVVDFGKTIDVTDPAAALREGAVVREVVEPSAYSLNEPTMFNLAPLGTGIINVPATMIAKVPIIGSFVEADQQIQAKTFLDNSVNQLNRAIATNPRFAEGERQQIQAELELAPTFLDRPDAYRQRLIGLDTLMLTLRAKAYEQGYASPDLAPDAIAAARLKVKDIDQLRQLIGAPPRVYSQEQRNKLPKGSYYLWQGSQLAIKR